MPVNQGLSDRAAGQRFPDSFVWGAATSAYQIEGSPLADGAGPSNWHRYVHASGRVVNGDTGDVACDHYRRWREDVALMKAMGLRAYRFSIAWARVLPAGGGRVNPAGLAFYERLVEALLAAGIEPFVTLYHWDLPLALEERGGWLDRDTAGRFADYAELVFRRLGDRVRHWLTLNEPWVVVDHGYVQALHPPALGDPASGPEAALNLLRAHALAVQAGRAAGAGNIGIAINLEPKYPHTDGEADRLAAGRAHAYMNRQFLDALLLGLHPRTLAEVYGAAWPRYDEAEVRALAQPIDFLGVNYYSRAVVRDDPRAGITRAAAVPQAGAEHTEMGWEVFPDGLTDTLLWLKRRYGDLPLYITENGAAFADEEPANGVVEDPRREDYLHRHLRAALAVLRQGVDLRGYFAWSLLDNFEWAFGYSKRFGLIHVDHRTQRRTLKRSALAYASYAQR